MRKEVEEFEDLSSDIIELVKNNSEMPEIKTTLKNSNVYGMLIVSKYLSDSISEQDMNDKAGVQKVKYLQSVQKTMLPIFLNKVLTGCSDRSVIVDYAKSQEFNEKQQKTISDAVVAIKSMDILKRFYNEVPFANTKTVESAICDSNDYCLKYNYAKTFPNSKKVMIQSLRMLSLPKERAELVKQMIKELQEMSNEQTK